MDKIGVAPECAGAEAEGVQIQRAASCYSLWMSVALGEKPNPLPCDFCVRNRATSAGFASSMKRRADNCWRGPPLKRSANAQHETEVGDGWASALPIVGETARRDGINKSALKHRRHKRGDWTPLLRGRSVVVQLGSWIVTAASNRPGESWKLSPASSRLPCFMAARSPPSRPSLSGCSQG